MASLFGPIFSCFDILELNGKIKRFKRSPSWAAKYWLYPPSKIWINFGYHPSFRFSPSMSYWTYTFFRISLVDEIVMNKIQWAGKRNLPSKLTSIDLRRTANGIHSSSPRATQVAQWTIAHSPPSGKFCDTYNDASSIWNWRNTPKTMGWIIPNCNGFDGK